MYEVNCFAGGISALDILPGRNKVIYSHRLDGIILVHNISTYTLKFLGVDDTVGMRVGSCIGYAILVYGLLFLDKVHYLSVGLGIVLVSMAILFLVVVIELGLDWKR